MEKDEICTLNFAESCLLQRNVMWREGSKGHDIKLQIIEINNHKDNRRYLFQLYNKRNNAKINSRNNNKIGYMKVK